VFIGLDAASCSQRKGLLPQDELDLSPEIKPVPRMMEMGANT
jgi:hypothetical protein